MGVKWGLGLVWSAALIVVLLFTSVEIVVYGDAGYFEKEYSKYNVAETVSMDMDELLSVTGEMMDYLKDKRDNLHIMAEIEGRQQEFFNEREITHMEDVKKLFIQAIWIRRIACIAGIVVLLWYWKKEQLHILMRSFQIDAVICLLFAVLLLVAAVRDFEKYFTIFHKIFFNNDYWILNPATDRLINIVPEPFFMDTAVRIGIWFAGSIAVLFVIFTWLLRRKRKTGV